MKRSTILFLCAALSLFLLLTACGGGGGNNSTSPQANTGSVNTIISDDPAQDWATVGVKVLSVTPTPKNGGTPVQIYGPLTSLNAPIINLVQLDQLGEIIGNATIPTGTYSQATITVSGNPSDILLTASPDPEPGFPVLSPTTIPTSQVCVVAAGSCGAAGTTVNIPVTLSPALSVSAGSSNALDLEFDLAHPAFIVEHDNASGIIWAVNFNPAVRHHPIADITKLVLRHLYGTNISVSGDFTTFTMDKIFLPVPAPTPISNSSVSASTQPLTILADSGNVNGFGGTIFWNLDASLGSQRTVISSFQSVASVLSQTGEFVRVQARYQSGGTLVAVRVWASTSFSKVFVSPEGHVLDVNAATNPPTFTILTESGTASNPIQVNTSTEFFFNNTQLSVPLTSLFTTPPTNFVRGFKVHVNPVDPTATQLVADTVNIEIARYDGAISGAGPSNPGFTYTRTFDAAHASDDYTINLDYISDNTTNGYDDNNNPITGFKWWDFSQPTSTLNCFGGGCVNGANNPITGTGGFVDTVTNGVTPAAVNYGNTCVPAGFTSANFATTQPVVGQTYATWNDPADPNNAWSAQWVVLLPTPAPLSTVSSVNGASFMMTPLPAANCTTPVTVDLDVTPGQATLAYLVSRNSAGIVTITSPAGDISVPANLATLDASLSTAGTLVKVYGVPVAGASGNGTIKAYVLLYFVPGTGVVQPAQ